MKSSTVLPYPNNSPQVIIVRKRIKHNTLTEQLLFYLTNLTNDVAPKETYMDGL